MIPTFIIDEPVLIFLGIMAGLFVPKGYRGSLFASRAFWIGSYLSLGFIALAAFGYAVAPDWMFMYFIEASRVPFWMVLYAFILYFCLYLLGFFLAIELGKAHRSAPWIALFLSLVASIAVVLPLRKEYQTVGTFREFYTGGGVPLSESAVTQHTTFPAIFLFASGIALLIFWARRQK